MNVILKVDHLRKKFGNKEVLKDVSLEVCEGDIVAFIGPNGAGKTTTIKCVLGLQNKDYGSIFINGMDITKDFEKAIRNVGAIVENPDSYLYMTGYQNMILQANLYSDITKQDIIDVLTFVGLKNRMNDRVSKYSLGMKQRLGIAKSLLHKPNLLILDEPTNGLDPSGIKELRELLKKLTNEGVGILISSHNLAELETFANKVCIIEDGITKDTNVLSSYKKQKEQYYFNVSSTKDLNIKELEEVTENSFIYHGTKDDVAKLIRRLVKEKIDIYEVKEIEISLEEAYLKNTKGEIQ